MREIEKIITAHPKYDKRYIDNTEIINMLKNAYNLGLQDAVDNVKHGVYYPNAPYSGNTGGELFVDDKDIGDPKSYIDKESILKLKL